MGGMIQPCGSVSASCLSFSTPCARATLVAYSRSAADTARAVGAAGESEGAAAIRVGGGAGVWENEGEGHESEATARIDRAWPKRARRDCRTGLAAFMVSS